MTTTGPDSRIGKVEAIECAKCGRDTKHTVRGSYSTSWYDDQHNYGEDYEHDLMACNGCEEVTYRLKTWANGEYRGAILLPARGGPEPRERKFFEALPMNGLIDSVYAQTISAYNEELPTLTGAGVRLCIEGICKEQGVTGGDVTDKNGVTRRQTNLEGKINALVTNGLISNQQSEALHEIRFLGNDAAHSLDQPSEEVLATSITVVEHILVQVYDIREHTKTLKGRSRPIP